MDNVVRLVRELIRCLVGDQDALYRIEIDEARVLGQLSSVHF